MVPALAKLFVSLLVLSSTPSTSVLSPSVGAYHGLGPAPRPTHWTNPHPLVARQPQAEGLTVWYLGHCGFAVQVGTRLLVFDYQEEFGTLAVDEGAAGFADGQIEPKDLEGLQVHVFTTHSHSDHFDPVILSWEEEAEDITYFFGWEAGQNPLHHYMVGPRASAEVDGLQVYTINSHHSGVPEVAFLVHIEGAWIYHNGDYRQDYIPDFEYLATLTDHMDLVFHAGLHDEQWQYSHQVAYLLDHFLPDAFFPTHFGRESEKEKGDEFARVMAERGYETLIPVPERRGDRWHFGG
jgi:L-ascorbate metabolism protein UlaG (beta-lactamase superfamily)